MNIFDSFNNYMNKIEADDKLKESTKIYVNAALEARMQHQDNSKNVSFRNFFSKRMLVTASSIAVCAFLVVIGFTYYIKPVNYICLDINPSIELGVNALDTVVSVEGINADGRKLIKGRKLSYMSVKNTIYSLILEAAKQDYIKKDGSTVIAVTAESEDKGDAAELQQDSMEGINLALDNMDLDAIIYNDLIDLDARDKARKLNVSPGKLKLVELLQALDPHITLEQYANSNISTLINDAGNLIADSEDSGDLPITSEDNTNKILSVAKQLQEARDIPYNESSLQENDNEAATPSDQDSSTQYSSDSDKTATKNTTKAEDSKDQDATTIQDSDDQDSSQTNDNDTGDSDDQGNSQTDDNDTGDSDNQQGNSQTDDNGTEDSDDRNNSQEEDTIIGQADYPYDTHVKDMTAVNVTDDITNDQMH